VSDPSLDPYTLFAAFLAVWVFKGVLEGLGGSGGSAYMAQRFYAAANDADCRRIGMLWTVLFAVRWPMVLGFAILAMHLGLDATTVADAENVLPGVLRSELFPVGMRGVVLAAMIAAAMSTFDSTINAGASYLVRDVYGLARPHASNREQVVAGYVSSALLVVVGLVLSFGVGSSVLGIWIDIVMLLFPAFLMPFALRWYWVRFNGGGFTLGIVGGFAAAAWFFSNRPDGWNEAEQFLAIAGASLATSLLGTLATRPVPAMTLRIFYERVRPFGLWPREWKQPDAAEHRSDAVVLVVALVWQITTFLIPMGIVLHMWWSVVPACVLWIALGLFLLRRNTN
jgi:Na+/proline symporter